MLNIEKPTLIINKDIVLSNINTLLQLSKKLSVSFRPHFKTHQSLEVGKWFKKLGINKITVSSVSMAEYFSNQWNDITIAFPFNILEIKKVNTLLKKSKINLLVDSIETIEFLKKNIDQIVQVYIKIDLGYNRAGIFFKDINKLKLTIDKIKKSNKLNFAGYLSHFGNTYKSKNKIDILNTYNDSINNLDTLNSYFNQKINVSIGDTPSISILNNIPSYVNEIRPGNFVFYDLYQHKIGSCKFKNIGLRMVCPIVSVYSKENKILIYGGSVHFSKDVIIEKGRECYGYVYYGNNFWDTSKKIGYIESLSQEHGIIKLEKKGNYRVGDLLSIIPIHSCLTADKMGEYFCDNKNISMMKI